MFRFAHIEMLWLLLLIPTLIAAFIYITRRQRKRILEFGDPSLLEELMPNASRVRPVVKFSILMVALTLLIFAAARPQYGQREKTVKRQGIEVMIALDVSNSMLAEDVAPNRLDRAKQMLSKLIDKMVDDKVGLVVFAGDAFVQLPITCDYVSAKMFLNSITPDLIKTQGTAIGSAINTSVRAFGAEESEAGRAIILITDGENHEDDAMAAAKAAHEAGIHIYVVGIGKPEGSPIPIPGTHDFRKDRQGNIVVTRLNEEMCRDIAGAAEGMYVRCDNTNTATRALEKELHSLATADIETRVFSDYNEQYQSFALVALLLLVIDFFIFNRKNKSITRWNIFGENRLTILVLLLALSTSISAQNSRWGGKESEHIRHGNRDYKKERYDKAELNYRRALDKNNKSYQSYYNLGNSLFRQEKYKEASEAYTKAEKQMDPKNKSQKEHLSQVYHNLGNAMYAQQQFGDAVSAYKESLRLNPKDNDTRYNLIKAMEMLQQQQQQQQKQDQKQNQQKQDQQQQQQQQQNQDQQDQQDQQNQKQEQQQQEQSDTMDKETAEQILQALQQDEQDTQDKLRRQQGGQKRVEKDW